MKIEVLELILDRTITCINEHTGIEDADDRVGEERAAVLAEVVSEAERLWDILKLCKSQGQTDVGFKFSKGER